MRICEQLIESGLDAGPDTIAWRLQHRHQVTTSVSTVARTLTRQSLVEPQPKKRPRSSYIRFEAAQPSETWQSDFTHDRITGRIMLDTLTEIRKSEWVFRVRAHRQLPRLHHPVLW